MAEILNDKNRGSRRHKRKIFAGDKGRAEFPVVFRFIINTWNRMDKLFFLIVFLLISACLILPGILYKPVSATNDPPVQLQYTPESLINDLNTRLLFLQNRTYNVGFYIHTIKLKENLWKLAARKPYTVHTLIGCNPQLKTYEVDYNQKIIVPSKGGTLHIVQPGETLENIAVRYQITIEQILEHNKSENTLSTGDMIFVPARPPDIELLNEKMRDKYEMRALFVSPLGGRLSSMFGMRKHPVTGSRNLHGGLDIAVPTGSRVGAAAAGIVILTGRNVGHYGTAVFIDHQNGYITHYGHLSKISVREGQKVKAYQIIGRSGSTGRSTGPHLHFTIKKNGVSKDPMKFIW